MSTRTGHSSAGLNQVHVEEARQVECFEPSAKQKNIGVITQRESTASQLLAHWLLSLPWHALRFRSWECSFSFPDVAYGWDMALEYVHKGICVEGRRGGTHSRNRFGACNLKGEVDICCYVLVKVKDLSESITQLPRKTKEKKKSKRSKRWDEHLWTLKSQNKFNQVS